MPMGWFKRLGLKRRPSGPAETARTAAMTSSPTSPLIRPQSPHDLLPVLPASDLLATPTRRQHLLDIERLAGIPTAHYKALYQSAIDAYAGWVQQLPASEAHHHSGPGGMLDHALEVTCVAMARRRVHLLPHGADPETISRQQHRWTYAVFSAALLHDVGKPAVDQTIKLFNSNRHDHRPWDPWSGPMPEGMWYRVAFVRGRRYRLHESVAPLLTRLILPQQGLSWLAEDHEILTEWLAAIAGDRENHGIVAEIVGQADGESVARNLGATDSTRFPSARMVPLHERLLTGLRYLLSPNALPLNRNGSAGWLVGEDLWLVSKRVIDTLRDHLVQEGHSGIPPNNERIFDELQENRLLTPNGDRAIWSAHVAGDEWTHKFTLLRFRASRIWSDNSQRPEPFTGTVTPIEEAVDSSNEAVITPAEPGSRPPSSETPETLSSTDKAGEPSAISFLMENLLPHSERKSEAEEIPQPLSPSTKPSESTVVKEKSVKATEKEGELGR